MTEQTVTTDGIDLCFETFGDPADATVLLIAGGAQSMIWWEEDFCARLAEAGRHVVRYDHRDTGRSTSSPAGRPSYTGEDLATDPLRLLDGLGVATAHVVGLSMGGGIAQYLALEHPKRVRTLCLGSTSPWVPTQLGRSLPGPAPQISATFTNPDPEPDWTDRDAVIAYRVDAERPYAGSLGFDEPRVRRLATQEVDRTRNMAASMTNHFILGEDPLTDARLDQITAPTLVLHGTTDPMFPIEHGEALAAEIAGARFLPLPGVGHQQPPPEVWGLAIAAIVELTEHS
ncbi:alpha/beta fold hydrolase [Actinomadura rudentiformis]|uniref:Alpha/beta hydrolase n=1 Tax=Actinomadura rudentiformis TaxID=359158 RepID=A0A6H9YHL1_9ACTN|nr:alpha/beta fold hydrolase [Actinomadura rudentiformis]KAB2340145.1 alpha/beta hydrolase [Actinomadura rudentiformis]